MRYLAVLLGFALAGCTYDLTLYPRGGGQTAKGTLYPGPTNMEVVLNGETYSGVPVRGQSFGVGFANTYGARPGFATMNSVGMSNQFAALLTAGDKTIRCEFSGQPSGGNGVCVDGMNVTYDLKIEPK